MGDRLSIVLKVFLGLIVNDVATLTFFEGLDKPITKKKKKKTTEQLLTSGSPYPHDFRISSKDCVYI